MKLSQRAIEAICDIMDHARPGESLAQLDLTFFPDDPSHSVLTISEDQAQWAGDLVVSEDEED